MAIDLPARVTLRSELMDEPDLPPEDTRRALADLDRVHCWLFGHRAPARALLPRILDGPKEQSLIDLGTGSGTVSRRLQTGAARRGVRLTVIGVDRKLDHLLYARELHGQRLLVVASAEALPFRNGASDWCFSNLFFHHFTAVGNRRILTEMQRIGRRGSLVVDLRQALAARGLVRLLLPLLRVGDVAGYDGRVSADQAWSLDDVQALTRELPVLELQRRFPFRFSLVLAGKDEDDPSTEEPADRLESS